MPKLKSHSGAKKRFRKTATGKWKHKNAQFSICIIHTALKVAFCASEDKDTQCCNTNIDDHNKIKHQWWHCWAAAKLKPQPSTDQQPDKEYENDDQYGSMKVVVLV